MLKAPGRVGLAGASDRRLAPLGSKPWRQTPRGAFGLGCRRPGRSAFTGNPGPRRLAIQQP